MPSGYGNSYHGAGFKFIIGGKMRWTDIRKKKPVHKSWKQYLVYMDDEIRIPAAGITGGWSYKLAMYCKKYGFCIDGKETTKVTHWMPLPKAPIVISYGKKGKK